MQGERRSHHPEADFFPTNDKSNANSLLPFLSVAPGKHKNHPESCRFPGKSIGRATWETSSSETRIELPQDDACRYQWSKFLVISPIKGSSNSRKFNCKSRETQKKKIQAELGMTSLTTLRCFLWDKYQVFCLFRKLWHNYQAAVLLHRLI